MSETIMGHKGRIVRSTDGGATYTGTFAEVISIELNLDGITYADVTNRDTSVDTLGNLWRERKPAVKDWSANVQANYLESDADVDALFDAFLADTKMFVRTYAIQGAGFRQFTAPAFIKIRGVPMGLEVQSFLNFELVSAGPLEFDVQA